MRSISFLIILCAFIFSYAQAQDSLKTGTFDLVNKLVRETFERELIKGPVEFRVREGSSPVNCVLSDYNGKVWIGTGKGVASFNYGYYNDYACELDHFCNDVTSLAIDTLGNIWAGTSNGLWIFKEKSWSQIATPKGVFSISSVICDHKGKIWISSTGGVYGYDGNKWQKIKGTEDIALDALLTVDNQNLLYIASSRFFKGLYVYDGKKLDFFAYNNEDIPNNIFWDINCLVADKQGGIWIGSDMARRNAGKLIEYSGAIQFNNGTWNIFMKGEDIKSICVANKGEVWMSTPKGLFRDLNFYSDKYRNSKLSPDIYGGVWMGEYGKVTVLLPEDHLQK